jgi:hypothetical protein
VISFFLSFLGTKKNEGRALLFTNFLGCRQWAGSSGSSDHKTSNSWQSQPVTPQGDKSTNGERRIEIHDVKSAKCKYQEKNRQNLDGAESPTQQQQQQRQMRSSAGMHTHPSGGGY